MSSADHPPTRSPSSDFHPFLESLSALLPRGWFASLQLEDPLTHTLEEVGRTTTGSEGPGPLAALSPRLPEGFTDPPEPWLAERLGLSAARVFTLSGERPFGRLLLWAESEARPFDDERSQKIRSLCESSSIALERGRSRREEEKLSVRVRRISAGEISARYAEAATSLLDGTPAAAVLSLRENQLEVLMVHERGEGVRGAYLRRSLSFASSVTALLARDTSTRRTFSPDDFSSTSEGQLFAPLVGQLQVNRIEAVPLESRGALVGALFLFHTSAASTKADRIAIGELAQGLEDAFDRIRPERRQATTFLYLQELFRGPGRNLVPLLQTVADEMIRFLGADAGLLALLDADTGKLLLSETRGYEGTVLPDSIPLDAEKESQSSISGQVVRTGAAYLASDTRSSPIYLPADPTIRSELGVPLRLRDETFGVMLASSRVPGYFTTDDISRFQLFADQVALAVDNARLLDSLRARIGRDEARRQRREWGFDRAVHASGVEYYFGNLVGSPDGPMGEVYRMIERVAAREEETVLIIGETGTGKEMIAHAIHHASPRRSRPLVATNFASLGGDPNLIQSELFGHERGSFTGASARRKGCFESANKTSLFIDEIGDIVPSAQVKLLRVLGRSSEREFQRLGGEELVRADVRVVAATNKDLLGEIRAGRFREDLYYRLSALIVRLPPLRSRPGDLPQLARHFLARFSKVHLELDSRAESLLAEYRWPGNIRQLESVLIRAIVLHSDGQLLTADALRRALEAEEGFEAESGGFVALVPPDPVPTDWFWDAVWTPWKARQVTVVQLEELLKRTLAETGGFYSKVAWRLGVSKADYQRFLDFLSHAGAKVDHRPFRGRE